MSAALVAVPVRERPILFSSPMVRAILDGRKSQTRRIVKPPPSVTTDADASWHDAKADLWRNSRQYARDCCPYGVPGERLWVRETWALLWPDGCDNGRIYDDDAGEYGRAITARECTVSYRASGDDGPWDEERGKETWKSPLFMPRWASRLTLEVTEVRVQRLQEITNEEAFLEGVATAHPDGFPLKAQRMTLAIHAFADLWDGINAKRGHSWESNPWVWAITFRRAA